MKSKKKEREGDIGTSFARGSRKTTKLNVEKRRSKTRGKCAPERGKK